MLLLHRKWDIRVTRPAISATKIIPNNYQRVTTVRQEILTNHLCRQYLIRQTFTE